MTADGSLCLTALIAGSCCATTRMAASLFNQPRLSPTPSTSTGPIPNYEHCSLPQRHHAPFTERATTATDHSVQPPDSRERPSSARAARCHGSCSSSAIRSRSAAHSGSSGPSKRSATSADDRQHRAGFTSSSVTWPPPAVARRSTHFSVTPAGSSADNRSLCRVRQHYPVRACTPTTLGIFRRRWPRRTGADTARTQ